MSAVGSEGGASLLPRIAAVEARALRSGALRPIATTSHILERDGLRYLVRILGKLPEKEHARREQAKGRRQEDPFLPYEEDLFISALGHEHVVLLNKFPVLAHHVLIVTRAFEHQESPLTEDDMRALSAWMREGGGLGFYNSGPAAGASQAHKHLQWVPTPLQPLDTSAVPIEPWLSAGVLQRGRAPQFPFRHAVRAIAASLWQGEQAGAALFATYLDLLDELHMAPRGGSRPPPYNLLLTRRWMLLVPRRAEHWAGVSINALGFVGAFLLRNEGEHAQLRAAGPLQVLASVAEVPKRPGGTGQSESADSRNR